MALSATPVTVPQEAAFRVGITGTRTLAPEALQPLHTQIAALLKHLTTTLPPHTRRHALSPLAEGADRILAEAALAQGWHLAAPLPFPPEIYESDFPATQPHFRSLLARAEPILLPGTRDHETAAYEAAGHFVVHNSDLLIVVWDSQTSNGRGGTAEIARFAAATGLPIWWLTPDGTAPPRLVRSPEAFAHPHQAPSGPAAIAGLTALLDARR